MISVFNLTYKIKEKYLVKNLNANFYEEKFNIILGPNGAGKSTLIKLIANQIKPDSGEIYLDINKLETYSTAELAKIRAVLSQNIDMSFPMKVWEIVMMGRYPHFTDRFSKRDEKICYEVMEFVGILDFFNRNYNTLSGGEKQRVHFARILSQIWDEGEKKKRYLLLDEPLTYLDVHFQFDFLNKISNLINRGNLTVIGIVHDLNIASKFGDFICLMNNGEIAAQGSKFDVITKENILNVFRIEPEIIINQKQNSLKVFF